VVGDGGAGGELPAGGYGGYGLGIDGGDVVDGAALLAEEMGVGGEVGAVAGGLAVVVDGTDEAALGEGLEAVVNGGEGDAGELFLDAHEDVDGGGVVALNYQGVIDFATLGGETESLLGDCLVAVFAAGFGCGFLKHWDGGNIARERGLIKNYSK